MNAEKMDCSYDDSEFWLRVGESTIDSIWNNDEDEVYCELFDHRNEKEPK